MSMYPIEEVFVDQAEANLHDSYEGLPPDYTLGHNMLAGAFAGIAVRFFAPAYESYIRTEICARNIRSCIQSTY